MSSAKSCSPLPPSSDRGASDKTASSGKKHGPLARALLSLAALGSFGAGLWSSLTFVASAALLKSVWAVQGVPIDFAHLPNFAAATAWPLLALSVALFAAGAGLVEERDRPSIPPASKRRAPDSLPS